MPRARPTLAVIVPVLREPGIGQLLARLAAMDFDERIVVAADDPSTAAALDVSGVPGAARVLATQRGRATQMNAGARAAGSDVLLFLHADTVLPDEACTLVRTAVARGAVWGRFDVRLSGRQPLLRVVERLMNLRSALTGIATGDQAMFVRRDAFALLGGFAPIPLMEDVELSARLKWIGRPWRIREPVVTSSRRWERAGTVRTVLRMWGLRAAYALGVSPVRLARWYR